MSTKSRIISVMILGGLLLVYLVAWAPKNYIKTFEGIQFRLGEENILYQEAVTIEFIGQLEHKIFSDTVYKGTISISSMEAFLQGNDMVYSEAFESVPITLTFDKENKGDLYYYYMMDQGDSAHNYSSDQAKWDVFSYGRIYFDEDFENLTIMVSDREDNGGGSWTAASGLMISANCDDRQEALAIANELMADTLTNNGKTDILE